MNFVKPRQVPPVDFGHRILKKSRVMFFCIFQSLEPPVYVMWLHGGVPVNYAPDRPRLTVQMEVKGTRSRSLLKIKDAK